MFKFSNPIKAEELEIAYQEGLPRIEQLEDGVVYEGRCRNASKAIWNKQLSKFIYVRQKFGSRFLESINHPANDDGFDLFLTKGVTTSFEDKDKEVYERDIEDFLKFQKI